MWAVTTPDGVLYSRFVVNAAGLYADEVARLAGDSSFTIRPRKGEEYLLDKRLQGLVRRVIFPCPTPVSKGILVIPTYDGTIMVGPTATSGTGREDLTTTTAGAEAIFAAVAQLVPGISSRDVIAQFAGLRAAAEGEDFIIGPSSHRGLIHAAGIQSPGLTVGTGYRPPGGGDPPRRGAGPHAAGRFCSAGCRPSPALPPCRRPSRWRWRMPTLRTAASSAAASW